MFDFITDPIENTLGVISGIMEGKTPTRRQVANLLADGVTIAAISEAAGISIAVLENLTDD